MKKNKIPARSILLFLFTCFLICSTSCKKKVVLNPDTRYVYQQPEQLDDGWETASFSDVSMDESVIVQFMNEFINTIEHQIHGILIVKDGKLVFEEYFPGYVHYHGPYTDFNRETIHNLASVTKSITSALIGLAIDNGFIQDVNQKVFDFFPEYADLRDVEKDEINLEHLLTMTSGLEWDENTYPYTDTRNDCVQMFYQGDPIQFILDRPVVVTPGTHYNYNGGCPILLGEIIRKTTGLRADNFAEQYLLSPLGITDFWWKELPNDICYTAGDMKLRPRDMAKFGNMYLNNGSWNGKQIISTEWIETSTQPFIRQNPFWEAGYLWWLHTYEVNYNQIRVFSARGWGGQRITVVPSLDIVVVFTAGYYDEPDLESHIYIMTLNILASAL